MNRTKHSPAGMAKALVPLELAFESALAEAAQGETPHTLFAPLHYESGYAYPLIVWLHGPGWDERHLLRIMPLVSMRNYVAIAPRGTSLGVDGKSVFGWEQTPDGLIEAEQRIFACVQTAQRKLHVAPHRVFLAGFDAGGTMAFRLALEHPEVFAGALSLCGAFPTGGTPFRNLTQARRVPLFLAAGRDSAVYPAEQVCQDLRLLHSAGMSITLRQYPCAHEIAPQMLTDVDRWVIEQITAPNYQPVESVID